MFLCAVRKHLWMICILLEACHLTLPTQTALLIPLFLFWPLTNALAF